MQRRRTFHAMRLRGFWRWLPHVRWSTTTMIFTPADVAPAVVTHRRLLVWGCWLLGWMTADTDA